ncbi:MAG: flagellar hook assembly protein FlgD [Azonexus sp.]|nr:flagellar hook assembly protein FlgD [Azonexus sp.]
MASVTNTTSTSAADTFAAINGTTATKTVSAAADQEQKFLTLLMTQIKNQDPLNPMDNAAVTTQLAQLNTVSGIEKLNTTLTSLLAGYNQTQAMQTAGMIGKSVMVAGKNLPLASGQAVGAMQLQSNADKVTLTISDSTGKAVQVKELGEQAAGNSYFAWDGKDSSGKALADGNYTFAVSASSAGKPVTATAMQVGTVSAVVKSGTGFKLDLGSMGEFAFSDVQEII